jgi:hypothetical protein
VHAYVDEWIQRIEDITDQARTVRRTVAEKGVEAGAELLPKEIPYPLPQDIARRIGCTEKGVGA